MTGGQKVIVYCAYVLAVVLIIGILWGIANAVGALDFILGNESTATGEMKTYSVTGEITRLKLEIGAADISIVSGENWKLESNLKRLEVSQENGTLQIEQEHGVVRTGKNKPQLTLCIPAELTLEEAQVITGAGVLRLDRLCADRLYMELGAGKAEIHELIAQQSGKISSGAGKVQILDGHLNDLRMELGVGAVELTAALTGESRIEAGVGSTDITLLGERSAYTVQVTKGLGSATVDGKSLLHDETWGEGRNEIRIEGGIGSIKVAFAE